VTALENVEITKSVRYLAAVATAPCSDTDLDTLKAKEQACYFLGIALLQGLGRLGEAVLMWRERKRVAAMISQWFRRKQGMLHDPRDLYFDQFWSGIVGHTALLGIHVKRNILERQPHRSLTLLCAPEPNHGNRWLVNQWKPYFRLAQRNADLPFSVDQLPYVSKNLFLEDRLVGPDTYFWQSYAEISRAWELAGGGALLDLSNTEIQRGKSMLEAMGIPRDARYVCLHVRSSGFKKMHEGLQDSLNASIRTYDLAIDAALSSGAWVIRMGDSSMPPLPPMPRVVDYAHSPYKKDWMDVFLCATCWFYVGTSSGLGYVPNLYGMRCVFTNWFPTGTRPLNSSDIFIPKLHLYNSQHDLAPFAESLAPPLGHIHANSTLRALGVSLRENTREELRDAVVEMMDRLEGGAVYTAEDKRLQTRFDAVANAYLSFGNAHIGRDFIRAHQRLLPTEAPRASAGQRISLEELSLQ
jgi:putative glycosyltransferase (TIGR04372 family)